MKILVQNHFCSGTTYTVLTEDEKGLIMQCTAPSLYGDTELKNHDNQTILTLKAPQFWTLRSREMNVSINSRIVFTFSTPHWTFTQRLLGYIGGKGGKPFSKAEYTTTTEQNGSIGDSICTIGPNGKQTEIVTWMEEPVGKNLKYLLAIL